MRNKYNYKFEYKNISNYSPFSHINELPYKYRRASFLLPIINYNNKQIPVHPDMFSCLNLDKKLIIKKVRVYPTSSFRTVFYPPQNICWKLPLKRKITRGLRDLDKKQIDRSEIAQKILSEFNCEHFTYLAEKCFSFKNPDFNYIKRTMPTGDVFPLFSVISQDVFPRKILMNIIRNIIYSWMFWVSKGLYLEYHSQNILVNKKGQIIYRDLSDIKSDKFTILKPSYYSQLKDKSELASVIFDRAVCDQNLDHFYKYKKFTDEEVVVIKDWIDMFSKLFNIKFPDYSLDFEPNIARRVPIRKKITTWRVNDFEAR